MNARTTAFLLTAALLTTGTRIASHETEEHPLSASLRLRLEAPGTGERYGASVANAGDVDGDGLDDVAVGAPRADDTAPGRVYVHDARTGRLVHVIVGTGNGDRFGAAVRSVPDVDGDGVPELWIDAPGASGGAGRSALHSGRTGAPLDPGSAMPPTDATSRATRSDLDGDGVLDAIRKTALPAGRTSIRITSGAGHLVTEVGPYTRPPQLLSVSSLGDRRDTHVDQFLVGILGRTPRERDRVEILTLAPR